MTCFLVILNIVDISPVHCRSTVDTEGPLSQLATPTVVPRSQRRRRGVEQLVARRVRLRRHDGCWGRVATIARDDYNDDDLSDNDEQPRQQLLTDTMTSQSAFPAGAASTTNSDYGDFSVVFNERKLYSFTV